MIRYGKTTQHAIAALSRLAETYHETDIWHSSHDIAQAREMSQPLVAKLLTRLSQAGLVTGSPGPHGGYTLTRPPQEVTLYDVAIIFERPDEVCDCPFGPNWCGNQEPCPLHHKIIALDDIVTAYLKNTHFGEFAPPTNAVE